jgi:hypothetical protein
LRISLLITWRDMPFQRSAPRASATIAMLDNIILPKLGAKKVDAIGRRDVEAIQVAMKDRPYPGKPVLSLMSKMFNLAVEWKWRPDNPAKAVERYQEQKRERWL